MRPFEVGDRLRVYYGADNGRHNTDKDRAGGLYMAEFSKDRVAGLSGTGWIRTKPLELSGTAADIRYDAEGDVELTSHPTDAGKAQLEFKLRNATLYSVLY
jgi:hypothetical protein